MIIDRTQYINVRSLSSEVRRSLDWKCDPPLMPVTFPNLICGNIGHLCYLLLQFIIAPQSPMMFLTWREVLWVICASLCCLWFWLYTYMKWKWAARSSYNLILNPCGVGGCSHMRHKPYHQSHRWLSLRNTGSPNIQTHFSWRLFPRQFY